MKISLLYLKKHIQNRSIVGKYNLLKRNSLRTILFLNKTKKQQNGYFNGEKKKVPTIIIFIYL